MYRYLDEKDDDRDTGPDGFIESEADPFRETALFPHEQKPILAFEDFLPADDCISVSSLLKFPQEEESSRTSLPLPSLHVPEPSQPLADTLPHAEPPKPPASRRFTKKKNYFGPLLAFLNAWFSGKNGEAAMAELTDFQLELASVIVHRKFNLKGMHGPARQALQGILASPPKSVKRTEENNKFVFKHALKLMKSSLKKSQKGSLSQQQLDLLFFKKFFEYEGAPKDKFAFLDPLSPQKSNSLSLSALRAAFESQTFQRDFYLLLGFEKKQPTRSELVASYVGSIPKKLSKLFRKWEKLFAKSEEECRESIVKYFKENTQCKLPWTVAEIEAAVGCVLNSTERNTSPTADII